MAKNRQIAESLVLLRMAVGAAGEDKNLAWWRSAFCGSMSGACLAPVFPKTVSLAVLAGVTASRTKSPEERRVLVLRRLGIPRPRLRGRGDEYFQRRGAEARR